jgi:hypothetical protein
MSDQLADALRLAANKLTKPGDRRFVLSLLAQRESGKQLTAKQMKWAKKMIARPGRIDQGRTDPIAPAKAAPAKASPAKSNREQQPVDPARWQKKSQADDWTLLILLIVAGLMTVGSYLLNLPLWGSIVFFRSPDFLPVGAYCFLSGLWCFSSLRFVRNIICPSQNCGTEINSATACVCLFRGRAGPTFGRQVAHPR